MSNREEIYQEIETHSDNGIPPQLLPQLVSEVLEVPLKEVKKVWKEWMKDSGWVL